ncbi:hypothetical protein U5A82_12895 [Sphingobium sp. CR2-8]|uniref:hypothetical protein n=1 Tax=Sphingobium sp. CR2-8 TaxID=1306534 RepID=UPI002DB9414F|nr:hypothetical protein [Sphingobium sp. CR2-8]MEC3911328.1 hypothetical protein [Sphingobium sp. CR2-8]
MLSYIAFVLAAATSDITVDEPITRMFGAVTYSEAICENHRQRHCENKDTRVGISAPPFYIYDIGHELIVIHKNEKCIGRYYVSYDDLRTKKSLSKVLSTESGCSKQQGGQAGGISSQLDDIFAAAKYMRERASVIFGPIEKRCKVKRDKTGWPISSTC